MKILGIGVDVIKNKRIKNLIKNKMLKIALRNMPNYVCIVPEKRKEITTEGGIN